MLLNNNETSLLCKTLKVIWEYIDVLCCKQLLAKLLKNTKSLWVLHSSFSKQFLVNLSAAVNENSTELENPNDQFKCKHYPFLAIVFVWFLLWFVTSAQCWVAIIEQRHKNAIQTPAIKLILQNRTISPTQFQKKNPPRNLNEFPTRNVIYFKSFFLVILIITFIFKWCYSFHKKHIKYSRHWTLALHSNFDYSR